jgi:hypothetical protein
MCHGEKLTPKALETKIEASAFVPDVCSTEGLQSLRANGNLILQPYWIRGADYSHAFFYRCPNAGLKVQGWIAKDQTERAAENYEPLTCWACARVHLVNPKNGKVLEAKK